MPSPRCPDGVVALLVVWLASSEALLQWYLVDSGTKTMAPRPRRDAAIGFDRTTNKLAVFGGRTVDNGTEKILGDTLVFDLSKGTWHVVRENTTRHPQPRYSMVYGSSGYYMYMGMGQGSNRVYYSDIWRFDFRTEEWNRLLDRTKPSYFRDDHWAAIADGSLLPEARYGAAGGIFDNSTRFFVSLGSSDLHLGDTFAYNIPDGAWYRVSADSGPYYPRHPHARYLHAGTMVSRDELFIFGGCLSGGHTGGPCPSADAWIFSLSKLTWIKQSSCPSPRTQASVAMLPIKEEQRRVILYGGQLQEAGRQVLTTVEYQRQEVGLFNPDTGSWTLRMTTGDVPAKKASVSMVTGTSGIYMFGGYDTERRRDTNDLYLLLGDSSTAELAPIIAECQPTFFSLLILHGVLMALSWGFFLPWGAFIARYLRHKHPLWFNLHKLFQVFGLLLSVGGFICALLSVINDHFTFVHGIIGLTLTITGLLQPVNACLRPSGDQMVSRKTSSRYLWELLHSFFGRCAVALGLVNVSLGIFLAHADQPIWIAWYTYLAVYVACHFVAELVHRRQVGQPTAQYIVRDIVPANELPPELFETFERGTTT